MVPISDRILILDFGSQYTQLIARRVREAGVYSEIMPHHAAFATIEAFHPRGIILSGGPASVYDRRAPTVDRRMLDLGVPILGICYGMQLLTSLLGGRVAKAARPSTVPRGQACQPARASAWPQPPASSGGTR